MNLELYDNIDLEQSTFNPSSVGKYQMILKKAEAPKYWKQLVKENTFYPHNAKYWFEMRDKFIKELQKNFIVENKFQQPFQPTMKYQFGMYLDNEFYSLILQKNNAVFKTVLDSLDAQILYTKILLPILAIEDLRNDERIEYLSGKHSILEIKNKIDQEEFEIGFILFPSNIGEIKALADANLIMPPKSTYIEPKFRSGLVVYEL